MTEYVKNVTFQSELGHNFKFDRNGDVYGQYQIYLFREKWKLKPYTENMIQKIALWDCKAAKFGYGKEPKRHYVSVALDVSNAKTTKTVINIHNNAKNVISIIRCRMKIKLDVLNLLYTFFYEEKCDVLITIFSLLGLTTVIIAGSMVVTFQNTHIIRASSWHLLLLLLFGTFLLFVNVHGFP